MSRQTSGRAPQLSVVSTAIWWLIQRLSAQVSEITNFGQSEMFYR